MEKAATLVMLQPFAPAREPIAWIHVPSQPLMRSPLSQFQTPTAPRRISRFFRVWLLFRSPCRADHSAYFGLASFISPILSAVDASKTKQLLHSCQCNSQRQNEISANGIVEKKADFGCNACSTLCLRPVRQKHLTGCDRDFLRALRIIALGAIHSCADGIFLHQGGVERLQTIRDAFEICITGPWRSSSASKGTR